MPRRRGFLAAGIAALSTLLLVPALGDQQNTASTVSSASDAEATAANSTGGSNYNFFNLDGCNREPYGVLKNFHTHEDTITEQLTTMHENGQERLIIGIFHHRGPETGTVMNSEGGDIDPRYKENLANLLATVKEIGYEEVEVAMHVLGVNSPNDWDAWNEDLYQENRQLIENIRPIVAESGIHYRLNLGNELTPAPNQPFTMEYTQRLWADYTAAHGKEDTVGFSVIGMRPERIASIPEMYGDNPPNLFDFHFYGDAEADEYQQFVNAHDQMRDMGYEQGWIVGEVYYNDPAAAQNISRAMADTGQEVHWLTQWPLTRERTCDDEGGHVDVAPPNDFDAFIDAGF